MIKIYAIIFLLLTSGLYTAFADTENNENKEQEPLPSELKEILGKVDDASEQLQTLQADVNYTRAIPLLEASESADGELAFETPDKIYMVLDEPRNEEMISDGNTWWIVDHNAQQVEIYDTSGEHQQVAEASFLEVAYGTGTEELRENYIIELISSEEIEPDNGNEENGDPIKKWHISFDPRDDDKPAQFERTEVIITERFNLPETIIMHESDGEIVHTFELKNIVLNEEVDPSRFEHEIPRGYSVIEP